MSFEFHTKAVGVSFDGRQENVQLLQPGFTVFWKHEKDNAYDKNAIALFADPGLTKSIGHLKKELAEKFVRRMERGEKQEIFVEMVTGGKGSQSFGVNMKVVVHGEQEAEATE